MNPNILKVSRRSDAIPGFRDVDKVAVRPTPRQNEWVVVVAGYWR